MKKTENPHEKHRERMRAKFEISGFSGMADHEILEFLLYYTIPVKNTNPIAHSLLNRFHTLERVFQAEIEELKTVDGIGEKSAVHIKAIGELISAIKKRALRKKQVLSSAALAYDYLTDFFINERTEKLYAFFLDKGDRLLSWKLICEGGIESIQLDAGEIVREAVLQRCVSVILAHNHPGGHVAASDADIAATIKIAQALQYVHVNIKDHIIIAGDSYYSMAEDKRLV